MFPFSSFFQRIIRSVYITKKMHRTNAVWTTSAAVVMVAILTSSGFGGGGKNAITAMAETPAVKEAVEADIVEKMELPVEASVQIGIIETQKEGRLFVGNIFKEEVLDERKNNLEVKEEIEKIKRDVLTQRAETAREKADIEAKKQNALISYTEEDYQILLKIVQAEAGICDEKGKILVANVILNRVESSRFPNSIGAVVYQKSQFSPVSNGSINTCSVTKETIDCVERALHGEDYSNGALFFMYRNASRSGAVSWFDSRLTFLFRYGNHEFFK